MACLPSCGVRTITRGCGEHPCKRRLPCNRITPAACKPIESVRASTPPPPTIRGSFAPPADLHDLRGSITGLGRARHSAGSRVLSPHDAITGNKAALTGLGPLPLDVFIFAAVHVQNRVVQIRAAGLRGR